MRVGDRVEVEGNDVAALVPKVRHYQLRAGGTLHRRWRIRSVQGSQPELPTGLERPVRGIGEV